MLSVWPMESGPSDPPAVDLNKTLLEVNGWWAVIPLLIPVLIAIGPLIVRKQVMRVIAAVVMGAFVLVSGFSIGLFYLPACVLMVLANCVGDSTKIRDLSP